jgi:small-conductance mechanosensitive channel
MVIFSFVPWNLMAWCLIWFLLLAILLLFVHTVTKNGWRDYSSGLNRVLVPFAVLLSAVCLFGVSYYGIAAFGCFVSCH